MNIESHSQNLKLIGVFLIGVVVGAMSIWMWTATEDALLNRDINKEVITKEIKTESPIIPVKSINTGEMQIYNDAITVRNQPAGLAVIIERVFLEEDGWVVIHEGTSSHIGNALGAVRFDKGERSGVVELLRATEVGMVYRAVLYRDNGDREFSLDSDFPFLQNGNQPILTTFIAQ